MVKGNDLGKDPIWTLAFKLAIPSMVAQLVNVLYSIIDRMYIGNIPEIGGLALAGVGICGPIVTLLSSFGTLIGLGGSILMAMRMGEKNHKQAEKILSISFYLLVATSIVLTVVFLLLKQNLLIWFGASDVTFDYANTYLTIYTFGTAFALLALGLNYFITCQGFATYGMLTVLIGAFTNILLDPLFIFVFDMGVAGAAWATVISQILSCGFAVSFLFGKKVPIRITFQKFSSVIATKIVKIGTPPFLILASDSIIIIVMNMVLQKHGGPSYGDTLISCATIIQSYLMLITGPMIGISGGTQAILSYNYGAGNIARLKHAEKAITIMCVTFATCMFFVSRFLPQYFVTLFTDIPEYVELSVWGIKTFTLALIPLGFQYAFVDGLTALGCTKTALCLSTLRKASYISFTIFLPIFFTAKDTFYAEPLSDILSASVSAVVFFFIFNRHLARREKQCALLESTSQLK